MLPGVGVYQLLRECAMANLFTDIGFVEALLACRPRSGARGAPVATLCLPSAIGVVEVIAEEGSYYPLREVDRG